MSLDGPTKERRRGCKTCIKSDFEALSILVRTLEKAVNQMIGSNGWQKTVAIMLLGGALSSTVLSGYVVLAAADTNSEQNSRLTALETIVKTIEKNQADRELWEQQHDKKSDTDKKEILKAIDKLGR